LLLVTASQEALRRELHSGHLFVFGADAGI